MKSIQDEVDEIREEYLDKLNKYAMKKFNAVIRPYFQRKGIAMRVGGGWGAIYFDNKSPKRENYRIADFPVEIKEILTAVVDGRFHLEDCMDDFTPEEK